MRKFKDAQDLNEKANAFYSDMKRVLKKHGLVDDDHTSFFVSADNFAFEGLREAKPQRKCKPIYVTRPDGTIVFAGWSC